MKEFKAGDRIRGLGKAYDPNTGTAGDWWGDMKYVEFNKQNQIHTCISNTKGYTGGFRDDQIELWDKPEEDSLTPEQVLAAELRKILTRADEIMKELLDKGFDTRITTLTPELFEGDEEFTLMPIEIVRENITYENI